MTEVRELWKSICATGVRPSGKNVPRKKRAAWHATCKGFQVTQVVCLFSAHAQLTDIFGKSWNHQPVLHGFAFLSDFFIFWGVARQAEILPGTSAACVPLRRRGEALGALVRGRLSTGDNLWFQSFGRVLLLSTWAALYIMNIFWPDSLKKKYTLQARRATLPTSSRSHEIQVVTGTFKLLSLCWHQRSCHVIKF